MSSNKKSPVWATIIRQKSLSFACALERFISSRLFLRLTFMWFIFQAIWMALSTRFGIPPDEMYHYDFIKLFAQNGWLPFIHSQYGLYSLGEVVHTPFFLYHYVLSLPFHLFSGSGHAVEILRLFNVALGAASFYLANKLAVRLKVPTLIKNLSMFMLANTLMFVFLAGSINYDNLLIPLSLLSFILMLDILDKFQASSVSLLVLALLGGLLTAVNFMPIAFIVVAILLVKSWRQYRSKQKQFVATWNSNKILNLFLLIPITLLVVLFTQRYIFNMANYHTYAPACDRIDTISQCMESGVYRRSVSLQSTRRPVQISPPGYFTSWIRSIDSDTFGILAHKSVSPNKLIKIWTESLLIVGVLAIARYYKSNKKWNLILIAMAFYTLILFMNNYLTYKHNGVNLGVQGKYLFMFLPVIYFMVNIHLLTALKRSYLQVVYAVLIIMVFMAASLPTYLLKTTPDWYTSKTSHINSSLHARLEKIVGKP